MLWSFCMYTCVIIVCFSSFYDKEAMLMDPVDGPILASLLGTFFFYCAVSLYSYLFRCLL